VAQVQVIQPYDYNQGKLSVAAYCRVSSNSEDQLNSYRTQVSYYSRLISNNPDWQLADIYADEGITGTSMKKREEFNRMIADCWEGKIDLILVKSVSRFARNTTELLEVTRELKELGVIVIFEEQEIDTSQMHSEMQLTLHAMAAQEESRSISQNMRWSYQKRMEAGTFVGTVPLIGFDLKNGNLDPNQDGWIHGYIFDLYNSGVAMEPIADRLNEQNIGNRVWTRTSVASILKNEKCMGDVLCQKKFTTDTMPFQKRYNHGEKPQYYIRDNHPGTVSRESFYNAKSLMEIRKQKCQRRNSHLFTHRIHCPQCNRHFRAIESSNKIYWMCSSVSSHITNCFPYHFSEDSIKKAFLNLAGKLYIHQEEVLGQTVKLLQEVQYSSRNEDKKLLELNEQLAGLADKSATLQRLNRKGFIDAEEYRQQSDKLAIQRQKLTLERNRKLQGSKILTMVDAIEHLQAQINGWPEIPAEFSIELFDSIVEKIIPTDKGVLKFRLHCGLEFVEVVA